MLATVAVRRSIGSIGLDRGNRVCRRTSRRIARLLASTRSWGTGCARRAHADARVDRDAARRQARAPGSGRARRSPGRRRRAARAAARGRRARRRRRRARRGSRATSRPALPPVTSSSASASVSGASRNCASPISSAKTPPGPNATSGPNIGSCTTPASSSAPPRTIGWTSTGSPMRSTAARTSSSSARSSATPPVSDLCAPAAGGLDDDREAELARPPRRPRRRVSATRSGTSGMP